MIKVEKKVGYGYAKAAARRVSLWRSDRAHGECPNYWLDILSHDVLGEQEVLSNGHEVEGIVGTIEIKKALN